MQVNRTLTGGCTVFNHDELGNFALKIISIRLYRYKMEYPSLRVAVYLLFFWESSDAGELSVLLLVSAFFSLAKSTSFPALGILVFEWGKIWLSTSLRVWLENSNTSFTLGERLVEHLLPAL